MRKVLLIGLAALTLTLARRAHADKFDSTLDISVAATNTLLRVAGDRLPGQWLAPGATYRIGLSLEGIRFGAGIGFFGAPTVTSTAMRGAVWGVPIELFAGYAFGSARKLQPYIEVRAAATHLFAPMITVTGDTEISSVWAISVMPRIGVRIPLSEYFFVDFGVGAGAGAERVQVSWAFGLPIPTSNL